MDKKRTEIIITVILAGILVLVLLKSMRKISAKFKSSSVPAASALSRAYHPLITKGQEVKKAQLPAPIDTETKWGRCPFSGKAYSATSKTEVINLKLTGIVWDESDPQALINGKVVQRFDRVGQFTVIEIYRDKVKLSQDGKYFEIYLSR
ncbi:MAG: hypothetical protein MUC39_02890 [Candidatus Omnitrophica bacterium]|jgi:hypothetical protein|nr:hypothetical protein [Candidatus Omnitrophota bacterium]